jgi:hypothetical protein
MTIRRGMDWMIGFVDFLYTPFRTAITSTYSAIANLYTLQFTVTYILVFSVFTSRILVTDLYESHCHCSIHELLFSSPNSFLAISSQSFDCHEHRLSQFSAATTNSGTRLHCNCSCLRSSLCSLEAASTENAASSTVAC